MAELTKNNQSRKGWGSMVFPKLSFGPQKREGACIFRGLVPESLSTGLGTAFHASLVRYSTCTVGTGICSAGRS